ncbi:MAG: YceI family protein [Hyphomicrobiales bacterium]|nr:YceI family protein [Hyphomicrobiales bacterium]
MKLFASAVVAASLMMTGSVFAGGHAKWSAVEDQSRIAFGSIKKDTVGEVHHFEGVTGTVGEDGKLTLAVDLGSVETNIDIRNERMLEHVFQGGKAKAMVSGEIDLDEVKDLKPGDTSIIDFEGVLAFAGINVDVEAEMLVARLAENRVLVSTADFIMVSTEDLGIDPGVNKLMELAKLPGITRVTPVAVRVVFEK